jgi:pyruvate formate lyase activating enzyme
MSHIHEALLYEKLVDKKVRCGLCAHRCTIGDGKFGICGVRLNKEGTLETLVYGDIIAAHVDPIEKKPLYHLLPGSTSVSIATIGCNFKCSFCQNWQISQVTKIEKKGADGDNLTPAQVVEIARREKCQSISYTYTEPTIFFEFALDTAKLAKAAGLYNVFVTNGYMTPEAIETIQPYLNAANVDLKAFDDAFYRTMCKARLQPVLDSIRLMKKLGIWVEVTTLLIPGKNDDEPQLRGLAQFVAEVDPSIPWHISRYHPDHEFHEAPATPPKSLEKARAIGEQAGLKYIYLGNVREGADTYCPQCRNVLVQRDGFSVEKNDVKNGKCGKCGARVEGVWK